MFAVRAAPPATDDFWYTDLPGMTSSGIRVSPETALALTAVYACRKVIYESIMQLPLILYRKEGRSRERATDHPLYSLLHDAPNEEWTAAEWRELQQDYLLSRGNAYSRLRRDNLRNVREIGPPLHPDTVSIRELSAGRYVYEVRPRDGTSAYAIPPHEMLHLRAMVTNGRLGMNPIEVEREAIGLGLVAQKFQSSFLQNDATPPSWIKHPTHFSRDEDRAAFKKAWQDRKRGEVAVFEYGMELHATPPIKLRDMEFLATRKYQNLDVCRIFRVPPHLIMDLDRATFSNISAQGIEFVKYTLLPWMKRWEQRLMFDLQPGDGYYFEFLVDGLERGDPSMRAEYYNKGVQDGWLVRNEVRERENLDPIDGLDKPLEPLNMTNPGGRNDENASRFSAMRANAARSLARKLRLSVERDGADPVHMADDIQRIMAVDYQSSIEFATGLAQYSAESFDDYEREAARRLMEI